MTPNTPMTELSEKVSAGSEWAQEIIKIDALLYVRIDTGPDHESAILCFDDGDADTRELAKFPSIKLAQLYVEIEQYRASQSLRAPAGEIVAVPQKMRMDGNALKAITFMLASADDDDDTPTDAVLWVGDLMGDDGKPVHGLHLANSEYPEEGSVTLVEFPAASPPSEGVKVTDEMVDRFGSKLWGAQWQRGGFEKHRAALQDFLSALEPTP